jgi:5-methylcytosine-specific restriction endonuclease McrA
MRKRKPNEALEEQYRLQGSCCFYCKESISYEYITKDHFLPVSKGNTLINNKVFACRTCNNIKGNRSLQEFKTLLLKKSSYLLEKELINNTKLSDNDIDIIIHYLKAAKNVENLISNTNHPLVLFT